jgi:hypothetical protein
MKTSKIRINPVTMEIEIEVSDSFLEKYFQKLTKRFPKSKKLTTKIKSIKTNANHAQKIRAIKRKKTKSAPVVKRRGSIQDSILEIIKMGKDNGVFVTEIVESTGLEKKQVYNTVKILKSKGIIKSIGRGKYLGAEKRK